MPSGSEDELNPSCFSLVLVATHLGCFPFLPPRVWAEPFLPQRPLPACCPATCPCPGWALRSEGLLLKQRSLC